MSIIDIIEKTCQQHISESSKGMASQGNQSGAHDIKALGQECSMETNYKNDC